MPTFIDESGDTGQGTGAASPYFRLAAVWVPSPAVAEAFRREVQAARAGLGLSPGYEFKFSKTGARRTHREAFFAAALRHEFRFAVSSIDKSDANWAGVSSAVLHWASAVYVAACLRPTYLAACDAGTSKDAVVVDDNEDQGFLSTVKAVFRGLGRACDPPRHPVGKVRFGDSAPDELVQLADMVCGAYGAHLDGDGTWYQTIAARDVGVPARR